MPLPDFCIRRRSRRVFLAESARWATLTALGRTLARGAGSEIEPAKIVRTLSPLSIRGVNYYPAQTPWGGFWTDTPVEVFERDLALMATLHVNAVRTFLPCSAGTQSAGLTDAEGNVNPAYLAKIAGFLAAAWRRGISTIFCFDFDDQTLAQAEGAVWRTAMRAFVAPLRGDGRVLMWDLMNEPEGRQWSATSRAYLKAVMPFLRELDDAHLTTVGLGWEIERLAELGLPAAPGTEEEQTRLYRIILDAAEHYRLAGVMPWCLHSYPTREQGFLTPTESMFGLVRHDGTLKPAAEHLNQRYAKWVHAR